ncbi:helix-turn-helix domain-containing protein [Levilactobacillus tujiorum]|uniref:Helix-turn-helix transcriptional regulator n=1 Tax=Levilactobacillus tujiorum TaxID=2912243 RepID=A0ABX1L426_9LACO|nr:helix-turn-helix transcriptional regulator [Levilactobacillus tujiorum]MCH5465483.1 helix-turn-helix transcriptional regulator [Levilactobacillus tujiorum]NLR12570.1 helix-turn-helix transcriptional regulator [Lactobacillus sp. HBUAS51387]NLR29773.1 helix-turn-helix transcriptional regulator [Levilactobacillus tujiorum]
MEFGERLKQTRQQQNLTQSAVAEVLHVSRQTISSWETGNSYPSIDSLIELSDFYHLSLDTLLKEDKGMTDTLRKPEVLKEIQPTIRNLSWINFMAAPACIFADHLNLAVTVLLVVAIINNKMLSRLDNFADKLGQADQYTRWRQTCWREYLIASITTIGLIWVWVNHQTGWIEDFAIVAVVSWLVIFQAEVGYFRAPEHA